MCSKQLWFFLHNTSFPLFFRSCASLSFGELPLPQSMRSWQDCPSLDPIHISLKGPWFHHRLTQPTPSKNWYLERRDTWPEGHWNGVIEKAGPKQMSMSFSLELPRFLSFPKPVCSSSPLVPGATQHPSSTFSLLSLLLLQMIQISVPKNQLQTIHHVVGWIVSSQRPPEKKKCWSPNPSVSKCDLIWK